jgi:hypothetical protein
LFRRKSENKCFLNRTVHTWILSGFRFSAPHEFHSISSETDVNSHTKTSLSDTKILP